MEEVKDVNRVRKESEKREEERRTLDMERDETLGDVGREEHETDTSRNVSSRLLGRKEGRRAGRVVNLL